MIHTSTPIWPETITNHHKYFNLVFKREDGSGCPATYLDQFGRRWFADKVVGVIHFRRTLWPSETQS